MNISKKTRYATRAMMELALLSEKTDQPIQVREIAKRQGISGRYLENIFATLVKAGILVGIKGKGGGFRLALPPEKIGLDMIVDVLENPLSSLPCIDDENGCPRGAECATRKVWSDFSETIRGFFHRITLADLVNARRQQIEAGMYHI